MTKDNIQKELFEFEAPKKRLNGLHRLFQGTNSTVSLPAEKLVVISIAIIMLLVVSFALGVERGKALKRSVPDAPPEQEKAVGAAANILLKSNTVESIAETDKNKPYMIVAAAFLKEASAAREAGSLKANGLEAFVYYSEPYYLACAGAFDSKASAQKVLNRVRQLHRDAYVRMR